MDMKNIFFYETSIGRIGIIDNEKAITGLLFADDTSIAAEGACTHETALIKKAAAQLTEYLAGKRRIFDVPMVLEGTPFQRKVWEALTHIPYGETRSYAEIAGSIGQPKACRAVGMANNKNPVAVMVPCHRVIGANGKLVGYAGGLGIKQKLLELEKEYGNRY
jgi:methylated-DNA-[protein]-cysteine S-methyltransferase